MIICDALCKNYGSTEVLRDFSYTFEDSGFYLLFGPSGCGKTTLINLLCGVLPFESGAVCINGQWFTGAPHWESVRGQIGYVTQQVHFVDYLTVEENLQLTSADGEKINELLVKYGLEQRKNDFPSVLSGGECQRLAIIQALVADKQIVLLDEPTASLDPENKRLVFELLRELSRDKCIICSSHDQEAKHYATHFLDFTHLSALTEAKPSKIKTASFDNDKPVNLKKRPPLSHFTKKWFSYKGRAKGSRVVLFVIFLIAFLAMFLGDTYDHKYHDNLKNFYRVNQLVLTTDDLSYEYYQALKDTAHVLDVSLLYDLNIPFDKISDEVNSMALVLPSDQDSCSISDQILYGTYFQNENQILLPLKVAESLTGGNPQQAVGQSVTARLYDGIFEFEIAGVFDAFAGKDIEYLMVSGQDVRSIGNEHIFLSSSFVERYIKNTDFHNDNQRMYTIYFDSYRSMTDFADGMKNSPTYHGELDGNFGLSVERKNQFTNLFVILSPFSVLMMIVAVLFFLQNQRIEAGFMLHIFALYQYHGYSSRDLRVSWIKDNVWQVAKLLIWSFLLAFSIAIIGNLLNETIGLFAFRLFTFHSQLLFALVGLLLMTTVLISFLDLRKLKMTGWNYILTEECDLL